LEADDGAARRLERISYQRNDLRSSDCKPDVLVDVKCLQTEMMIVAATAAPAAVRNALTGCSHQPL